MSSRFRSLEAIAFILAGAVVLGAQWKSFKNPDYDPMPETTAAFGLITAVWLVPTRRVDEKINDALDKVDKEL